MLKKLTIFLITVCFCFGANFDSLMFLLNINSKDSVINNSAPSVNTGDFWHFLNSVPEAKARDNFYPTGGLLVTGTENTIVSNATSGNVGSWKGLLAQDATAPGMNWTVTSNASTGLNQLVYIDNSELNNANKMEIVIRANAGSASLNRFYQICDWVSNTSVDNAADAYCTGGGWRNLNIKGVAITGTAITNYTWHIYDGYWTTSDTSNVSVSTPLSNFISNDTNKRVLLRAYSTTALATTHTLDYVLAKIMIDPVYMPAGFTQLDGGAVSTSYINTTNGALTGQSANDSVFLSVPGTASAISSFYTSFKNIRTYPGANSIVYVSDQRCSTTGINVTPRIYNFSTTSWEDLTTAFNCSTTETARQFAIYSSSIGDYISNGEMRIGWFGSTANTLSINIDYQYAMIGSVNTDSSQCEISFGSGTASNCANTRNMDSTLVSPSTWQITSEAKSATFSHTFYGEDEARTATTNQAMSSNLYIPVNLPSNASISGWSYAGRWRSNSTTLTTQMQMKDKSGGNITVSGGWTAFGTTNAATTYSYQDAINNGYFINSPGDYLDVNNKVANVRIRTSATTLTSAVTGDIDYVMIAPRWVERASPRPTTNSEYSVNGGNLVTGAQTTIVSNATSGNVGSWKGLLAQDAVSPGVNWTVTSNATNGLNQNMYFDDVTLNGSNKMEVVIRASASATTLSRVYQICDWVSNTSVDNAADAYCTGGGWRTLNIRDVAVTATAITNYTWHIYDGYWTTSTTGNTTVSTPLSNFISSDVNHRVLLRAYSTSAVAVTHTLDFVHIRLVVDPVYLPAGFTQLSGGTVASSYTATTNGVLTGQSGSDNAYLSVPGTASAVSNFYTSFKNVQSYTGMNSIVYVSEQSCSTTGISVTPRIYNFTTTSWENLTTAFTCSTTDTVRQFAIYSSSIGNYISNGEIRIGWLGSANNTLSNRLDYQYVIVGSVNVDTSQCEISFGSGTVANCANTRTMDSTLASPSTWQTTSQAKSATFSHTFYGEDEARTATTNQAMSANLSVPIVLPTNASIKGWAYAGRWRSNSTALTTQMQLKDTSGANTTISGGWTAFGTTNAATGYTYQDSIAYGYFINSPEDYTTVSLGTANVRIRTSATTLTSAVTGDIDYVMIAPRWVEAPSSGVLSADIVDASGVSVASPSVTMGGSTVGFSCQTVSGTFSTSTQKIRINNASMSPAWTLTVAASGGSTDKWTSGTNYYDFNDSSSCGDGPDADTLRGQLSIDPGNGLIASAPGCTDMGVSLGSAAGFVEGTTDNITLLSGGGLATAGCYWDVTNMGISQALPPEQIFGNYNLNLVLTITAN